MDFQQYGVVVRDGFDLVCTCGEKLAADGNRPRRNLACRCARADPDLGLRLVAQALVAPDKRRQH